MQREVTVQNGAFSYVLRRSDRARRVRLAVHRDGRVIVTTPARLADHVAEQFLHEKTDWVLSKINYFSQLPPLAPRVRYGRVHYRHHKDEALRFVRAKVEHFSARYGFSYNAIRVKNQRSCWGSCSRKRNLNFNYKILFLPADLQDYVIVHELCHLQEMNHSARFWALVGQAVPDPKGKRRELKKVGMS